MEVVTYGRADEIMPSSANILPRYQLVRPRAIDRDPRDPGDSIYPRGAPQPRFEVDWNQGGQFWKHGNASEL